MTDNQHQETSETPLLANLDDAARELPAKPSLFRSMVNAIGKPLRGLYSRFMGVERAIVTFFTKTLSLQQLGYITAFILFVKDWDLSAVLLTVALLVKEFWPKLINLWRTPAGKLSLLFVYAVVGNFALVAASGLVNEVSGVAANHLPYTHNFAVLLMVPEWFLVATVLILLFFLMWLMIYILWLILVKLINHTNILPKTKTSFPVTTVIVKMIVIIMLFTQLGNHGIRGLISDAEEQQTSQSEQTLQNEQESEQESNNSAIRVSGETINFDLGIEDLRDYKKLQTNLIKWFVYELEADEYSRCESQSKQKVIELNPREALFVSRNGSSDYQFTVAACKSAVYPLKSD